MRNLQASILVIVTLGSGAFCRFNCHSRMLIFLLSWDILYLCATFLESSICQEESNIGELKIFHKHKLKRKYLPFGRKIMFSSKVFLHVKENFNMYFTKDRQA